MPDSMQTIKQRFQVEYNYAVFFTQHLFDTQNPLLKDCFQEYTEQGFQRKALVIVDEGFEQTQPDLKNNIRTYFAQNVTHIQLAPEIISVPGGEACKNDPSQFDKLVEAVDVFGIDRHSFVIGIGGGAVLDLDGRPLACNTPLVIRAAISLA